MRFTAASQGYLANDNTNRYPNSTQALNGKVYMAVLASGGGSGQASTIDFVSDRGILIVPAGTYIHSFPISGRNSSGTYSAINSSLTLVNNNVNDVAAAVIPNAPTQTVTVSGWGFQSALNNTGNILGETVNLPYTFNSPPKITVTFSGAKATTDPTDESQCIIVGANSVDNILEMKPKIPSTSTLTPLGQDGQPPMSTAAVTPGPPPAQSRQNSLW